MDRRVVVTGMGAVSALGLSWEETWLGLLGGGSGVSLIETFDTEGYSVRIAAGIRGLESLAVLQRKDVRRACRFTQLAVVATMEALADARLDLAAEDTTRVGIVMGSAAGGIGDTEEQAVKLYRDGHRRLNPVLVPMIIVSAAACHLAVQFGIRGPAHAPAAACATGIIALGDAMRILQHGDADVVVAGSSDAALTPLCLAGFARLGPLSTRNEDPAHACRPFDASRDGTVLGEGAAVLILETEEHALRRGATVLAEVAGYAVAEDAFHMVAPDPTGAGAARAMARALADGGVSPEQVGLIVAHGTGTPLNDVAETLAIHKVFGEHASQVVVTSNKGAIGHTLGAAGAFSIASAVQTLRTGLIPPTTNLVTPDPDCDLDYCLGGPRPAPVEVALVNAVGFGGQNAALVLRRRDGE